jgi:hypothetical protein
MKIRKFLVIATLATAGGILAVSIFMETYGWQAPIIEEMKKQGFDLVSEIRGSARILPWTFFFPYVTNVTLVHPNSIKPFKGFIVADAISFGKNGNGEVESWPRIVLFDCASNRVANLADQQGRYEERIFASDGAQVEEQWFKMNDQMRSYFCKNVITAR